MNFTPAKDYETLLKQCRSLVFLVTCMEKTHDTNPPATICKLKGLAKAAIRHPAAFPTWSRAKQDEWLRMAERHAEEARKTPASTPSSLASVVLEDRKADTAAKTFTVWGNPVGKPRQTQRDKWAKRPCVMRYRAWADSAREAAQLNPLFPPYCLRFVAFLPIPKSASKKQKAAMTGRPHRLRGDIDNFSKSIMDALFEQDGCIAILQGEKRWDDGLGSRVEITLI